jgi:hypothetical protein
VGSSERSLTGLMRHGGNNTLGFNCTHYVIGSQMKLAPAGNQSEIRCGLERYFGWPGLSGPPTRTHHARPAYHPRHVVRSHLPQTDRQSVSYIHWANKAHRE